MYEQLTFSRKVKLACSIQSTQIHSKLSSYVWYNIICDDGNDDYRNITPHTWYYFKYCFPLKVFCGNKHIFLGIAKTYENNDVVLNVWAVARREKKKENSILKAKSKCSNSIQVKISCCYNIFFLSYFWFAFICCFRCVRLLKKCSSK